MKVFLIKEHRSLDPTMFSLISRILVSVGRVRVMPVPSFKKNDKIKDNNDGEYCLSVKSLTKGTTEI